MKKYIVVILLPLIAGISFSGCKKFLNVVPIDNLSGNNFWKTKSDFDEFAMGIYNRLRDSLMMQCMFFPATGDFRCAPANATATYSTEYFFSDLRKNALTTMLARSQYKPGGSNARPLYTITLWDAFYSSIAEANILYSEASGSTVLSADDIKSYQAEAVFQRCLCYFLMVRVFGDVPYYTDPFHSTPLPRTPMVEVLRKCISELTAVKNDLPWSFDDPNVVGTRANRGAAIDLLMHMNMWLAGFDNATPAAQYYQATANLGAEIMDQNGGAYALLPLSQTPQIFRGHSKESLFEFVSNYNGGEIFNASAVYSTFCLSSPYASNGGAYFYYDQAFMLKLYPNDTTTDLRRTAWFMSDLKHSMYNIDGSQVMTKFIDTTQKGSTNLALMNDQIVFRYTDAVLLRAEALSDLSKDDSAQIFVNMIRARSQAAPFTSTGQDLKDAIYWERVRELMGEGYYYYDLVRTHKLVDGNYCYAPISSAAFNSGGWTWPLDATALGEDPDITLNQYWQ